MAKLLLVLMLLLAPLGQSPDSGRCADVGETADLRVSPPAMIAPGAPPVLSFRYYEGKEHQRFGNSDLMLDDAGH